MVGGCFLCPVKMQPRFRPSQNAICLPSFHSDLTRRFGLFSLAEAGGGEPGIFQCILLEVDVETPDN